jgi:hypothetical protein
LENQIDFIGDVHGHADELEQLLDKLGYIKSEGAYSHKTRKAFFVGDYIDRGPKIKETLEIVRGMVDTHNAVALMGNHEYNALCFHFQESEGGHLRKHLIKNIIQHFETLRQFQNRQELYEEWLEWFKTLPLFYETSSFRAVHACWDPGSIRYLHEHLHHNRLTDDLIYQSVKKDTPFNQAIEMTLKGKEIGMPDELSFKDKDGTTRREIRIKWWDDPMQSTYRNISIEPLDMLPEVSINLALLDNADHYQGDEKPVFFGHYWLKGSPMLYRNNICCLDYSVAKKGHLVAYRFDGERLLDVNKFIYI